MAADIDVRTAFPVLKWNGHRWVAMDPRHLAWEAPWPEGLDRSALPRPPYAPGEVVRFRYGSGIWQGEVRDVTLSPRGLKGWAALSAAERARELEALKDPERLLYTVHARGHGRLLGATELLPIEEQVYLAPGRRQHDSLPERGDGLGPLPGSLVTRSVPAEVVARLGERAAELRCLAARVPFDYPALAERAEEYRGIAARLDRYARRLGLDAAAGVACLAVDAQTLILDNWVLDCRDLVAWLKRQPEPPGIGERAHWLVRAIGLASTQLDYWHNPAKRREVLDVLRTLREEGYPVPADLGLVRPGPDPIYREGLAGRLLWNSGGYGLGTVASAMIWALAEPESPEKDLKSVVAVGGPPDKYTDEELERLVLFSEERTRCYDALFRVRMGCNLTLLDKQVSQHDGSVRWLRKRLTWSVGPMFSTTLDEALAVMTLN